MPKQILLTAFFSLILAFSNMASASIETYPFDNAQQEQDYKVLINELRCLVCQNQNLADSNAELAQDLRKQIHTMLVEKNQSKEQVVDFMVNRYGDFVLYKPPVKSQTYLLWAGPFLGQSAWCSRVTMRLESNKVSTAGTILFAAKLSLRDKRKRLFGSAPLSIALHTRCVIHNF